MVGESNYTGNHLSIYLKKKIIKQNKTEENKKKILEKSIGFFTRII
jgi:hypothetical protein